MAPELSVAVGGVHVTVVEVLLRSAVAMISEGQLMKVGFETSLHDGFLDGDQYPLLLFWLWLIAVYQCQYIYR